MGPEEYISKGLVLVFGAIGAGVRLLRYPPRTPGKGAAILLSGTALAYAATPWLNRIMFNSTVEGLPLLALFFGVVGMSVIEGGYLLFERNKEEIVRHGIQKGAPGLLPEQDKDSPARREPDPEDGKEMEDSGDS